MGVLWDPSHQGCGSWEASGQHVDIVSLKFGGMQHFRGNTGGSTKKVLACPLSAKEP